jgi:hypothetical protein
MKVDCRTDPDSLWKHMRPFLDGHELFGCFFADEEAGRALVLVPDERGTYRIGDPARGLRQPGEPRYPFEPYDPHEDNAAEVMGHVEIRRVEASES